MNKLLCNSEKSCTFAALSTNQDSLEKENVERQNKESEESYISNDVSSVVGDAVGVSSRHWYVALVGHNTEKACREHLCHAGFDCFVASQSQLHQWKNGRKSNIEQVVIPGVVFVHVTEQERLQIVNIPYIKRFLTDPSRRPTGTHHPLAIVREQEMERLRFMLYQTDHPVFFDKRQLHKGNRIRVLRGQLKGLEGLVSRIPGKGSFVVANLGILGCAFVQIPLEDIQIIQ